MYRKCFTCRSILIISSDGDPLISRKLILLHISERLDSILIFIKHFFSVVKISKTFVFFQECQVNIQINIDKDPFSQLILENRS